MLLSNTVYDIDIFFSSSLWPRYVCGTSALRIHGTSPGHFSTWCCLLSVFTTCPFNAWKDVCADTRGVLTASFKNLLSLDNTRPYCTRHVGQLGTHTYTHTTQLPIFVMRGGGGG